MSIGATLAAARRRSGLTLDEVSERAGVAFKPIIREYRTGRLRCVWR